MPAIAEPDAARVASILSRYRDSVLATIRRALDRPGLQHTRLMRYHLGWEDAAGTPLPDAAAGKMLRPALCLLCCEAVRGNVAAALSAAAAIELVHNFSLIHDDIEDKSDMRHGRETLWRVAGVPHAINAGDGMFALARRTLLEAAHAGVSTDRVLEATRTLDDACIALCEGQYADIEFETRPSVTLPEYEQMIGGKTAALLSAAAATGAILGGAGAPDVAAIAECGRLLGLAFQIQDDVLGIWGEAGITGKPVADDIRSRKKSFPIVYSLEHLDGTGRARLQQIYSSPDPGDADVDAVLSLLGSVDARHVATDVAGRWARSALDAISDLDLDAEFGRDLEALASFFVYRDA